MVNQLESRGDFGGALAQLVIQPGADQLVGLIAVLGADPTEYQPCADAIKLASERLIGLRALFIGEMTGDECEISWIFYEGNLAPVAQAYPKLTHLQIRGGAMSLAGLKHAALTTLIIESGGLDADVIGEVLQAKLPALEHLELWLGTPNYGGIEEIGPLKPLLDENPFPKLRRLGLRNSELADEIAIALTGSRLMKQLEVLDLSLGNLSDQGAKALLKCINIRPLKTLDIHHHFVSPDMLERLKQTGVELIAHDEQQPDGIDDETGEPYRYCAVME